MPFWMENPEHGVMPVYDRGEVERVKQWGWRLLNEGESPVRATETPKADQLPDTPVRKKPGPKPKAKQ